jgi:integrase
MKDPLHRVLVIVAVLTGLRASELAGLQWQCVDFVNNRIVVNKRWALGEFGKPKTECSDASVSMGEALSKVLSAWRQQTPYCQPTDFVFASFKSDGAVPHAPRYLIRSAHSHTCGRNGSHPGIPFHIWGTT